MSMFDFAAFDRTPLQRDPCDYVIVPRFVTPEALEAINRDYPAISKAGNFKIEEVQYGPAFQAMLDELNTPKVRQHFAAKFGMDLEDSPLQLTVRKYSDEQDGNVHNDSRTKRLTVLIYFNNEWHSPNGQLRIVRNADNVNDYFAEIPPVEGNLICFRRNEQSFHGFPQYIGERRSIQFYWIDPKRAERKEKEFSFGKWVKRLRKVRPR